MNNEEIAKHTGVSIERVNQIEAEVRKQLAELRSGNPDFDRILKAVTPCPVFVEAADHERLKQERDNLAAQLTSAKEEAINAVQMTKSMLELLREIRDGEVNPEDEADKYLRDHTPSELSTLRDQLATVIKERDEFEKLSLGWEYECGHDRARIDALALQLADANERAEKAESAARENDALAADGQALSELVWAHSVEGSDAYEVEDILELHYKERDSLLLQLQQQKERAAVCNRLNTAYSENLLAVQAALDFLDEGSGANTTVALGLKAAEEINSLRTQLLQCQAACAKKDEALHELDDSLKICFADSHAIGVEWLRENGMETVSKVVENIRKHSGAKRGLVLAALSTSPATALAKALESAWKEGSGLDRSSSSSLAARIHEAWLASDIRKKLP